MVNSKLLLIVNPRAGMMRAKPAMLDIIDLFCASGRDVTVCTTKATGDAIRIARERAAEFGEIICCGGDGTFSELVNGVMPLETRPVLGYIPAGTTNDFASSMKISGNILEAARRAVGGDVTPVDIGRFNNRYFTYIASFGAFTGSSYQTPQTAKNALGHLAYVLEGVKDITNIRPYRMRVKTDDDEWEDNYLFGSISNSTSIAGLVKLSPSRVDMRDGLFEVILVKNPLNAVETQKIITCALAQQGDGDMVRFFSTSKISFFPEERIPWSLDGEYYSGSTRINIENIPKAINIRL